MRSIEVAAPLCFACYEQTTHNASRLQKSGLAKQYALQIEATLTETNSTLPKPVAQLIRSFVTAATPSPEQKLADVDSNSYMSEFLILIQKYIQW